VESNIFTGLTGPTSFGSGGATSPDSSSGDVVGLFGASEALTLPQGYVSGTALSDTAQYNNATFSSLGATPGTYEWTWGTGAHADSFTLQIGTVSAVPAPALGSGMAGLAVLAAMVAFMPLARWRMHRVV
jgi:hypothetical protein